MVPKTEDDYRAESDHRTLSEAEEIRNDPHRMRRVHHVHRKKARAIKAIGHALRSTKKRSSGKSR
jgi:hypothetical protein